MNDNNSKAGGSGLSFVEALQIVFIVLKLCKVIKWSWLWVLAPTWMGLILALIIILIVLIISKKRG